MGNSCCAESQVDNKNSTPIASTQGTSAYNSKESGLSGSSARNCEVSISGSVDELNVDGEILPTPNLREFTFAELKSATKNFKSDMVLGEGGFGKVYKGWIDEQSSSRGGSGCVVAVKKLNSESMQGFEEWQSEVNFLGRLSHPNLVRLLGFCWDDTELLLNFRKRKFGESSF